MFEIQEDFQLERGFFLMRQMRVLGYHAVGVGEKDLGWGVKLYQDSCKAIGLLPVSANLVNPKTGKLLFKPYSIETVAGVKVGVFSVLSPKNGFSPAPLNSHPDSLKYLDVEETVRKVVAELRPKCQLVVGLLNVGNHDADLLAAKVPGMDVVLVGGGGNNNMLQMIPKGTHTGSSLLVSPGPRGQYVGQALISMTGTHVDSSSAEVVPLGDHWPEAEVQQNLRKDFEDTITERIARRQRQAGMESSKKKGPDHYIGYQSCVSCHPSQKQAWWDSKHRTAMETLMHRHKDNLPDCVPCHVTGYQKPGGYFSTLDTGAEVDGEKRRLDGVQCEACHGMGTRHDSGDRNFAKIARQSCVTCHTKEMSPEFNFEKYWEKIKH